MALLILTACGYRPVSGRVVASGNGEMRFLPMLVTNNTAELALSHLVADTVRNELGRRGVLASGEPEDGIFYRLDMRIVRFYEQPAAYSPDGTIIEYYGEMYVGYSVYAYEAPLPIAIQSDRITYRYDFNLNPQITRQYRYAAMAAGIRAWIPHLLYRTAYATVHPLMSERVTAPASVTAPVVPPTTGLPQGPIPGGPQ